MVARVGFEPTKLREQRIYSPSPLTARESRLIHFKHNEFFVCD